MMAKAIFLNIPAHGHMNPTLPLTRELVVRGETITYYTGEDFREKVKATGAEYRPYTSLGETVQFRFGDPAANAYSMGLMARVMIEFTADIMPPLFAMLEEAQPDYLLHDFTCIWGRLVAHKLGIPAVEIIPQFPVSYRSRPDPYPGMWRDLVHMLVSGIPHLRSFNRVSKQLSAAYGTPPVTLANFMSNHETLNIVFTSRYFQPNADDFDEHFMFVGPSIGPRDERITFPLDFPTECSGPLIYISLGTTLFNENVTFYHTCMRAFGETDKRVIISAGKAAAPALQTDAPHNVIVQPYVPQLEILKLADVFITHGGMGSISEGLLCGVPLIVVPQAADQPFVAQRVKRLGAGYVVFRQRVSPTRLNRMVDDLIADDAARVACDRIAESFKTAGGYVRAAEVILDYVAARRPGQSAEYRALQSTLDNET